MSSAGLGYLRPQSTTLSINSYWQYSICHRFNSINWNICYDYWTRNMEWLHEDTRQVHSGLNCLWWLLKTRLFETKLYTLLIKNMLEFLVRCVQKHIHSARYKLTAKNTLGCLKMLIVYVLGQNKFVIISLRCVQKHI